MDSKAVPTEPTAPTHGNKIRPITSTKPQRQVMNFERRWKFIPKETFQELQFSTPTNVRNQRTTAAATVPCPTIRVPVTTLSSIVSTTLSANARLPLTLQPAMADKIRVITKKISITSPVTTVTRPTLAPSTTTTPVLATASLPYTSTPLTTSKRLKTLPAQSTPCSKTVIQSSKRRAVSSHPQKRTPPNLIRRRSLSQHTSSQRGRTLKSGERRAVINVHNYFSQELKMNGPTLPLYAVRDRTASALGIHVRTVSKILNEYEQDTLITTPGKKRPRTMKAVLDQVDDFMKSNIRRVIYNMYTEGKAVTLATLLKECQNQSVGFPGSISSLRKVVINLGFKWKKVDNRKVLMESANIAVQRTHFLRAYINNMRSGNPLQVIFMDETWIFQRGTLRKCWQDGSKHSTVRGDLNDGRRFIVVHAGGRKSFVPNSGLIFASGNNTGDYHGDMNSENFEKWLRNMLGNLDEKSLIIMDNASYHSVKMNKQPTSTWTKGEVKRWLEDQGIPFPPNALKPELVLLAKQNKRPVEYRTDHIIKSMGHEVLRLPPYHCHFNAIELIWATAKTYYNSHIGEGGDYSIGKTKAVWETALNLITAEEWSKRVDHVEKLVLETWEKEMGIDASDKVQPLIIHLGDSSDDEGEDGESENNDTSDDDEVLALPL